MTFDEAKRWLLQQAANRGVDAEVLGNTERELRINARDGKADETTVSQRGGMGLRVVDGGRVGYSSTEDLSEESLAWALDEAIDNASLQADGKATLRSGEALGRHDLMDEGLSGTMDEKLGMALELEKQLKTDERVQSIQYSLYTESQFETHLGSTKGVDGSYRRGTAAMVAGLVMREGASVKQGFEVDAANDFHQLDPGRTGQLALDKIGRQLGARALATGRRRAVFEPDVVTTLLQLLVYSLSGKSLAEGKSGLQGKLGELRSYIENLVSSGFVTDQASGAFNETYQAFTTNATEVVENLTNLGNYLTGAADTMQSTDEQLAAQARG